jgi:predicted phage baseplate assembly protein
VNVVARRYRFGGGKAGNLPAGAIKDVLNPVDGMDSGGVANLLPSHSGRDEESLAAAKKRAPGALRSRDRAVTAEDFEHLAQQAGTIRRAKALPLFHPEFPDTRVPGVVTVIVVPDSDQPRPLPSEGTLRTVCALLDQKRLLTTEVYVIPPSYREVRVQADVVATDSADLAALKKGIEDTLLSYFHPLVGGEDGGGWPFGGDIAYSRVYQRVFTVPGVQRIERLALIVDGEECPECRDVVLPADRLVFSTAHEVDVRYDFGE